MRVVWSIAFAGLVGAAPALAERGGGGHMTGRVAAPAPVRGPAPFRAPVPAPTPHVVPHGSPQAVPHGSPPPQAVPPGSPQAVQYGSPLAARPHLDGRRWVGHDAGPRDVRFHVERPWVAGRFRFIGRSHPFRLDGWDAGRHRFWFRGYYFGIASWEIPYVNDWNWSADEVVIYDDPDHDGWYLAYNTRLGTYVHVQYDGGE